MFIDFGDTVVNHEHIASIGIHEDPQTNPFIRVVLASGVEHYFGPYSGFCRDGLKKLYKKMSDREYVGVIDFHCLVEEAQIDSYNNQMS